jgi:hypothetical protein
MAGHKAIRPDEDVDIKSVFLSFGRLLDSAPLAA